MLSLLQTYSITEIVIFVVMLAIAIKGVYSFYDWAKNTLLNKFQKHQNIENKDKDQDSKISAILNNQERMSKDIQEIYKKINVLQESDKDSIKSFILKEHDYFVKQGNIDHYSLDILERRYSHYLEEGGNSFVSLLMDEIRALPL